MEGQKKLKAVLVISILLLCAAVGSFIYGLYTSVGAYKEQTHNPENILIELNEKTSAGTGSNIGRIITRYTITNKTASDGLTGVEAEIEYYSGGKRICTMIVTFNSSSPINRGKSNDFNVETTVYKSSEADLIALYNETGNISIKYTITRARFTDWTSPYGSRYTPKSGGSSSPSSPDKQTTGGDTKEPDVTAAHVHTAGNDGKYSSNDEKHWLVCAGCGQTYDDGLHTFGEWRVTKAATETAMGTRERTCSVCGYKQTETIAKLSHTHSWSSSWTNDKTYHWHVCSGCSEQNSKAKHTYGSWTVTKEATTTSKGSKYRICTVCGYKQTETIAKLPSSSTSVKKGDIVALGSYPQSEVTDIGLKSTLTSKAGALPTSSNNRSWTNYNYFPVNPSEQDFMWYVDIEYKGAKYRGVYFTSYRPTLSCSSGYVSPEVASSYQSENGYKVGNIYWFKYEPLKWKVLFVENGEILLWCNSVIDSMEFIDFDDYLSCSNNYANSNIRAWLNSTFYNTAFSSVDKEKIIKTTVDNGAKTTNPYGNPTQWNGGTNKYVCSNTSDYVFLLSVEEVTNTNYGFAPYSVKDVVRQLVPTSYAKAQGVLEFSCFSPWWLRSPDCYFASPCAAHIISIPGNLLEFSDNANQNIYGVSPALKIRFGG